MRTYHQRLDGRRRALEREHRGRAWLAWHSAGLTRVKQMPELDDLTGQRKRAQTVEEQKAAAQAMVLAAGGRIVERRHGGA